MAPEDWLQAEMQGEIVALVHSHPGGLPWLSEADRRLPVSYTHLYLATHPVLIERDEFEAVIFALDDQYFQEQCV